eukprot:TRINITY_DN2785_c0_g1_i2.p1 TRINITY_DN2785_c0_g1~~TRINITY_DN2785_c0_g1_i2.p1  ORF type:complete len:101 (-),score=5.99 TRINITY_DN2785_c0_g1_i2:69-371(-)
MKRHRSSEESSSYADSDAWVAHFRQLDPTDQDAALRVLMPSISDSGLELHKAGSKLRKVSVCRIGSKLSRSSSSSITIEADDGIACVNNDETTVTDNPHA